ncbi:hypothetical protein HU200_043050 [Digitaria exilis]|uniref:Ubiquitin-like domain-containing protein n=1 Tax=Digitaria exilis TaxID=1010633 RepID=A0A835B505_9POAL|nr:hypothetical protein HU200_043050 [Digitaria exilis]
MGEASKIKCQKVPIFIRHCSGMVVLRVKLDEPAEHMMHLYEIQTKMKLLYQHFKYGNSIIDPKRTLLSYGVGRDATVDACGRLLGGKPPTLDEYFHDNKDKFLRKVTLPDGNISVDMEKKGCRILSSWLKCFTRTMAKGKTWAGRFTLQHFKVVNEHVKVLIPATHNLNTHSLKADMAELVRWIKGMLLVLLRKKYKSLSKPERNKWRKLILHATLPVDKNYPSCLSKVAVFEDIIAAANQMGKAYRCTKNSIFSMLRDEFTHGVEHRFDKTVDPWKEKFKDDDGIELMIPAYVDDFPAQVILAFVESADIDITEELLACQVRCFCHYCQAKPPDNQDASDPGPSSNKNAAGLGLSDRKEGTSSGPSQKASSMSYAAALINKGTMPCFLNQCKSVFFFLFSVLVYYNIIPLLEHRHLSHQHHSAGVGQSDSRKSAPSVPPPNPTSSQASKPKPPPPQDDDGFQLVMSKKANRRRR